MSNLINEINEVLETSRLVGDKLNESLNKAKKTRSNTSSFTFSDGSGLEDFEQDEIKLQKNNKYCVLTTHSNSDFTHIGTTTSPQLNLRKKRNNDVMVHSISTSEADLEAEKMRKKVAEIEEKNELNQQKRKDAREELLSKIEKAENEIVNIIASYENALKSSSNDM